MSQSNIFQLSLLRWGKLFNWKLYLHSQMSTDQDFFDVVKLTKYAMRVIEKFEQEQIYINSMHEKISR